MGVLLDEQTRVVIQGFGGAGQREARNCIAYGTAVVCGVTPGRGGQEIEGVPIRNTVQQAVNEFGANVSLIFVPAAFAADAILEAADAGIPVAICITEGIPTRDMVGVKRYLRSSGTTLIGPNCPGVMTPGARARAGIMPPDVYTPGNVGVISRSGTLVYEAVDQLTRLGIGQSSSVGVGGDPIIGTSQREALALFEADTDTAAVVMIGEIGGTAEQEAAEYIKQMSKPVVAFIAGATAPPGRRMGHAGAIIAGKAGTAQAKQAALMEAGATVVQSPSQIGVTTREVLKARGLA
ncbi:MAG: succinate--CoA ligase subunit alpha [Chloroflexi bacterium]|nr:succinate--CoA ligase subunit alpha [Chloroflexota bacterium]